jgi:hypothetical protein
MKANQLYGQTKTLKTQLANAQRQMAELNRLCLQYPGTDYDHMLTQRKMLYGSVKRMNNELEQMKGNDSKGYQRRYSSSTPKSGLIPVKSKRSCSNQRNLGS